MSNEADREAGWDLPDDVDDVGFFDQKLDEELDQRLHRVEWPVAPAAVRERSLVAVLARQASLANPESPPSG